MEDGTLRLRTILKLVFITVIIAPIALVLFKHYTSPEQRLKRQIIKNFTCPSNKIKIQRIDFVFKAEVCDKTYVYVECGCCDEEWFEQCKPASDKYWLKLCNSEARHCLDKCMEARKLVGLGDFLSSAILCKEIDKAYESQQRGNLSRP